MGQISKERASILFYLRVRHNKPLLWLVGAGFLAWYSFVPPIQRFPEQGVEISGTCARTPDAGTSN